MSEKDSPVSSYIYTKEELDLISKLLQDPEKSGPLFDTLRKMITEEIFKNSSIHDNFKERKSVKPEEVSDLIIESLNRHYEVKKIIDVDMNSLLDILRVINKRLIHVEQELIRQNIIKKQT
jgi:hypothetical protein